MLACFPIAGKSESKTAHSEAARQFNESASKLLVAVSDSIFTSAHRQQKGLMARRSVNPAPRDTIRSHPQTQGTCNVLQACLASSQAFALWSFDERGCNTASSTVYGGAAVVTDAISTIFVELEHITKAMLPYCKSIIRASMETWSDAWSKLGVCNTHLREVLKATGRLLELVCYAAQPD